ncbi:Ig-like domain-containing protein [Flagellatimonas centrodinii]|uniref:Ig-like domain-containing protein n=1 Tax=Flagellatimonas centrodinii TaxID=2806210 RepID=UPI001FEFBA55|nr:Ig-like domain-containing protein [Flagellatimonas centrodinii]ULQ47966.1 Ig-like domain-containing protein [Flagellatimonas centrodinii]
MKSVRVVVTAALLAACLPVHAAGMVVHALMADYARQHLPTAHPLKRILDQHRPALLAGAMYPDGGYATGALFPEDRDVAENAHWEYFVNPLMQLLHERGCATAVGADNPLPLIGGTLDFLVNLQQVEVPLADIRRSDDCGSLVAFAMGVAAHGMGDEVWDALFEPVVRERGEHIGNSPANLLDSFPPGADTSAGQLLRGLIGDAPFEALAQAFDPLSLNSIEYAMDVMAIFEHDLWLQIPYLEFPPDSVLVDAYARTGRNDPAVTAFAVQRTALATRTLVLAERAGAAIEMPRVSQHMPWASANYFTGQGGVLHTSDMISGYYLHLWNKLANGLEAARGPRVVGLHPHHGAADVPFGLTAEHSVIAFLSGAVDRASTEAPGAIVVFDETGAIVPGGANRFGYRGDGAHGLSYGFDQPLEPDHEYTVVVTTRVRDSLGRPLQRPRLWRFTTAAAP